MKWEDVSFQHNWCKNSPNLFWS